MKIGVVGCGAVGSFYGAQLCRAGLDVHFLLRSDYEIVRRQGVCVQSPKGDFHVQPRCASRPDEIGPCDLVLIALKATANDLLPRLVSPLVGPQTAVLTLQNGLGNEEALAKFLPVEQVLGGLCFVCLNRIAPGVIRHSDHGQIVIGEFGRPSQRRTQELATVFNKAGISCIVSDDLARAHWEKLVWNIPFNGLGVAGIAGREAVLRGALEAGFQLHRVSCLPTNTLLGDPGWAALLRELMVEVITAASALGLAVQPSLADRMFDLTRTMGAYRASTLLDFEKGQPLELESLFLEPLRRARAAGVSMPRLAALCAVLAELARLQAGEAHGSGTAHA